MIQALSSILMLYKRVAEVSKRQKYAILDKKYTMNFYDYEGLCYVEPAVQKKMRAHLFHYKWSHNKCSTRQCNGNS